MEKPDYEWVKNYALQAVANDDYTINVIFADGREYRFDMRPIINEGGVWTQIKDIEIFKKKLTIINNTPAWDLEGNYDEYKCLDIDPEIIRQDGDLTGSGP
ncbi:MAG: DUF2442 domain-containing protein [Bacillota bacterium]